MIPRVLNRIRTCFNKLKHINLQDHTKLIEPSDFLLFCHDSNRGLSLNSQAYSPLLDSIKDQIEAKGFTCMTIAHPWSRLVGEKGYGNPIAINRSNLYAKVIEKLFGNLGLKPELRLYESIISLSKPKVMITIGCSDSICEAARNLSVFHAELLHGIGYTSMKWNWDKKAKEHLPQCIISLDPVSTRIFSELEKKGVVIKEIPHPFLRRFQDDCFDQIPSEWRAPKTKSSYNKEILISLQWGYASGIDELDQFKGVLDNGLFYKELEKVIEMTHNTIFWRFRLHPVQYRNPKKYNEILDFIEHFVNSHKNCDWKESTYIPLPSLLPQCSGHITMSSMCSYEAAYLGVTTLALAPSLREQESYKHMFNDLVSQGYLIKGAATVDYILEWVKTAEKKEPLLNNIIDKASMIDTIDWLLSQAEISEESLH